VSAYWEECLASSFEENDIIATPEQIAAIARDIELGHDVYGQYHGHDCIPNPVQVERDELAKKLEREKLLVLCGECNGRGRIWTQGPHHGSDSECWKCHGEGKIDPRL
jgi:hypothetical protein